MFADIPHCHMIYAAKGIGLVGVVHGIIGGAVGKGIGIAIGVTFLIFPGI